MKRTITTILILLSAGALCAGDTVLMRPKELRFVVNSDIVNRIKFEYDAKGNISKLVSYEGDTLEYYSVYSYDAGNRIAEIRKYEKNRLVEIKKPVYVMNRISEMKEYSADMKLSEYSKYVHAGSMLAKIDYYKNDGKLYQYVTFEYDMERLARMKFVKINEYTMDVVSIYKYDMIVEQTLMHSSSSTAAKKEIIYEIGIITDSSLQEIYRM